MRTFLIIALLLTLSFSAIAQPPPDFTLYDQDSVAWNLYTELGKGNTVVLDFFFASCVPCQTYTPEIEQLYQDYGSGNDSLIVLGISDRDNNATLASFDSTYGVSYPSGGTQGEGNNITNLYSVWFPFFSWPNYAVVCPDTTIAWGLTPSVGMADLRNKIDSCGIPVGIGELGSSNFDHYPNPSRGMINVLVESPATIQLYNLSGMLIGQISYGAPGAYRWYLNDIPNGYYLLSHLVQGKTVRRDKLLLFSQQ